MSDKKAALSPLGRELQGLLAGIEALLDELYHFKERAVPILKENQMSSEDMVDIGFLFRELENRLDDSRKDCKATKELIGKIICLRVAKDSLNNLDADPVVRGVLARGTPDVRRLPALPRKGTPEYVQAMKALGVQSEAAINSGCLKFDFHAIQALINECAAAGKKPPPGLDKDYPEYTTVFTRIS